MNDPAGDARLLAAVSCLHGLTAPFAVAVSGGGDSMALLHLAHRACPGAVRAVTVDHGLRPDSAAEAATVAAFCAAHAIAHTTLRWQGPLPGGNLMDQARHARTRLIADWAKGQGVSAVLLGHTADDQAETLLMTLARAAGLDGLSGLRPQWQAEGITWHRPLLEMSRADLRRYLVAQGLSWAEDPSNDNDRFTRARARKALKALAPLGLTAARLAHSVRNLAAARAALQEVTAAAAQTHVREIAGALVLDGAALDRLPDDIQRRLLIAALRWISAAPHPPREAQLAQLRSRLQARRDATLGGVRFRWTEGRLMMVREPRAAQGPVPMGRVWDGRWQLSGPAPQGAEIRALGPAGLRACPDWQAHGPREALIVSPALWVGDTLIAAPLAGFSGPFHATLSQPFAKFILSH